MVKINKSMPAPVPITKPEDFRHGPVFEKICNDFYCKCYLCEDKPTAINIEHIVPHKNDDALKYDWENLFLACVHCNNTKLALERFDDILDCTKEDPEEIIHFKIDPFPKAEPKFELRDPKGTSQHESTIELLNRIFCQPSTAMKSKEAIVLCEHLHNEIMDFIRVLDEFFNAAGERKAECYTYVSRRLDRSSPFAAFKRTIVRELYSDDFGAELEK